MEKLDVINNRERFEKLKEAIKDYLEVKDTIKTGIDDEEKIEYQKERFFPTLVQAKRTGKIISGS